MCGIAGFFSVQPQPAGIIGQMTDLIRHRGPDDEGFALFQNLSGMMRVCGGPDTPGEAYEAGIAYAPKERLGDLGDCPVALALGHRRLSIVDLSPLGHQPMCTPDERFWIVFNGEIYNHVELRAELEAKGHRFLTHSDTEVMLAAYREWGGGCLERFNGMFAFLIYDMQDGKLFAARDRFGIKPLYYRVSAQGVAFASEIKQFTALPDWQARMNGQRAYDFLNWGVLDHTDETMFDGVFQLRGGEALELDVRRACGGLPGGRLPVFRWYRLGATPFSGSMEDAAEEFRYRFTDAVRLHLRADVPVGSCLSGGLDSSSIVCVMNELLRTQGGSALQNTFSACADVKRFDEREWIEEVVKQTGVSAHYVYPGLEDLFAKHGEIVWHQDEPFGSTSIYAQWNVFKSAAEQGVKVMLDGQGADEQLAGYHTFFGPHFAGMFKRGQWFRLWREIRAAKRLHGYSEANAVKLIANMLLPEALRQKLRARLGKASATPEWLSLEHMGAEPRDPFVELGAKATSVRAFSVGQLTALNLQMLLHWEDRDSMAHSIEARVPFLDYRLVEYVLGLPDEFKLQGGVTKRVLREGMRGILPERIRTRLDKLGFVTPEEVWLRERGAAEFRAALDEAIEASQGVLNHDARKVLDDMIAGRRPFNFMVWRMISFGAWMKEFNVVAKI
jgi:asparagine synthase (glutamine-hydrolysing)